MDETTREERARAREERARAFGVNSKDYDAVRPGYPDQLFADLLDYAALREGARVLEIGCGTGQATRSLVDRAIDLTCLEPSETLSDLARVTFADRPNVEILTTRFEAFDSPEHDLNLVLAALTEDIRTVINGSYGGVVTRPYRSVLRIGRRTPQARDVEFRWS